MISWFDFKVLPENIPQRRAGIYLIENLCNGMKYIGISYNLARRVRQHAANCATKRSKIGRAINAAGAHQFLVIPLFYSITGTTEGLEIDETSLIKDHGCIEHGYNIAAAGRSAGPYGPAFSAVLISAFSRPDIIARIKKVRSNPEWRKRRAEAIRAAYARPEVKEFWRSRQNPPDPIENAKRIRAAFQRPEAQMKLRARRRRKFTEEARANISARVGAFKNTEKEKTRVSKQMLALFATDEFKIKHLEASRTANAKPERNEKIKAYRVGGCWITDGTIQRYLTSGEELPAGWKKGRLRRPKC